MNFFENTPYKDAKKIHFVGIGGSGMFPLAQILAAHGYRLTGSDNNLTDTLRLAETVAETVYLGHSADHLGDTDLVVHTAAVHHENPELAAAVEQGIPVIDRALLLGLISQRFPQCLCIAGTHGKTTTTAMLTKILLDAGRDPTAVIGGKLKDIGGNGRAGHSGIMVAEACEYVNTYHQLHPSIAVILNIDADHLEFFKTLENIQASFRTFAQLATDAIIHNGDDANTRQALAGISNRIITFGREKCNNFFAKNVKFYGNSPHHSQITYDVVANGVELGPLSLDQAGEHNVLNSLAAAATAIEIGVSFEQVQAGLAAFSGAGRRFEILGKVGGATIVDDYAHHPAELTVTLSTAKTLGYRKVWAVFQPFTFSRTKLLLDVLTPIMGGREENLYGIDSEDLQAKLPGSVLLPTFQAVADHIKTHAGQDDLVITLGCGDIYKAAKLMLQ